jgi:hypothetical protein
MIDPSRVDMNTAIVVFVSATRRYRSASEELLITPPAAVIT